MKASILHIARRTICIIAMALMTLASTNAMANKIAINEENFPDAQFRSFVLANFDLDEDGQLGSTDIPEAQIIEVSVRGITTLKGIEYLTALETIICDNNEITTIDLSNCTALKTLVCNNNQLAALDVSNCTALTEIVCNNNKIEALDVRNCTALTKLVCDNNQIAALDVSNCTLMTELTCDNNKLAFVNLATNTALTKFSCKGSANSHGVADIKGFSVEGLDMTRVSDVSGATVVGNKFVPTDASIREISFTYNTQCAVAASASWRFTLSFVKALGVSEDNIPDATFREYVSANFDTNSDGLLSDEEIAAATKLNVQYQSITSLKGIEHLTALEKLDCSSCKIASLDVSTLTALKELRCWGNNISALNLSNNKALEILYCNANQLNELNVGNNTALRELYCQGDKISTLDLSHNTELTILDCTATGISSLDLKNNTKLKSIECSRNNLTSLDVSTLAELTYLNCYDCQIASLDLSNNTKLEYLKCSFNKLTELNVDNNTLLTELTCDDNGMTHINLENNTALTTLYCYPNVRYMGDVNFKGFTVKGLDMERVSDVEGAKVVNGKFVPNNDKVTEITYNYNTKYATVGKALQTFKLKVTKAVINIAIDEEHFPDAVFRGYIAKFDTDKDNMLSEQEIENAQKISVYKKDIASLKGIEYFTALISLNCSNNKITELDLSDNMALTYLDCTGNKLTILDLRYNTALETVYCSDNCLKELNLETNTGVTEMVCSDNVLDMGDVDFKGFSVEGLDMKRVSDVKGASVVDGKFVPTYPNIEEITYTYDTKCAQTEDALQTFKLRVKRATTTAIEGLDAQKKSKAVKTIEDGRIVIVRDGVKWDLMGLRIK